MPYLLDSDVLIDISRGRSTARKSVNSLPTAFLSAYVVIPLRESMGRQGYYLLKTNSKSHGLQVFDSLAAATAMDEGLTLVSRNRKHYQTIKGLRLEVPEY